MSHYSWSPHTHEFGINTDGMNTSCSHYYQVNDVLSMFRVACIVGEANMIVSSGVCMEGVIIFSFVVWLLSENIMQDVLS